MKRIFSACIVIIAGLALVFSFSGCGGGGSDAQSAAPPPPSSPKILNWIPPTTYADGTALDPARDLSILEIYVNTTGTFGNNDTPIAYVSAIDQATGRVSTSFDLSALSQFLSRGVQYRVAMRSVAQNGNKSSFSASAAFSL